MERASNELERRERERGPFNWEHDSTTAAGESEGERLEMSVRCAILGLEEEGREERKMETAESREQYQTAAAVVQSLLKDRREGSVDCVPCPIDRFLKREEAATDLESGSV